jgi:hypothetical protein
MEGHEVKPLSIDIMAMERVVQHKQVKVQKNLLNLMGVLIGSKIKRRNESGNDRSSTYWNTVTS